MNTEQLKTDRQAIEILREEYKAKLTGDQLVSLHREIDEFCDDEELEPRNAILSAMDIFASQESKRAVDEALIDKDFIIYCLNQSWNYAHEQLQKKYLGDIERDIYQKQKDKAKALMTKLDSLT